MSTSSRSNEHDDFNENPSVNAQPPGLNRKYKDIMRALIKPSKSDMVPWSSSDLRAMLEHQLDTPLAFETARFAELANCSSERVTSIINGCRCHSFGDLLRADPPIISGLVMLKDYAKASLVDEHDLPKDVARVLYVIAILRGRKAGISEVSSLDNIGIERAARRCLTYGWIPDDVRNLLSISL